CGPRPGSPAPPVRRSSVHMQHYLRSWSRLLSQLSGRVRYSFHYSCSLIAIVLTIFSGSGRARSIDNSPFFKSAPSTCIPSASTNGLDNEGTRDIVYKVLSKRL